MEQLIQKYVRYFYIALIGGILMQMIDVVPAAMQKEINCSMFILIFLSIANIILLISNLIHNIKQQFTECKINSKILRISMLLLIGFQMLLCFNRGPNTVILGNCLMTIVVIEIVLSYRIKSIEYLENLANRFIKENALDRKGE